MKNQFSGTDALLRARLFDELPGQRYGAAILSLLFLDPVRSSHEGGVNLFQEEAQAQELSLGGTEKGPDLALFRFCFPRPGSFH
jgi:hypothetical protein